jgi:glycosyltransferase involved in cell wall biosynthesis
MSHSSLSGHTPSSPAVSVIVACYQVTPYVAEALDSLRCQTFRNFETIVINDGCPDTANLEQVLEPYREEIVYLKQSNQGVAAARNKAILAARSPLIALLDGDDVWESSYLAKQVGFLDSHPEVDVVYPNACMFGDNPWAGKLFMDEFPSRGEVSLLSVIRRSCSIYVGLVARREKMERVGLFDSRLRAAEDLDLWLRMLHSGARFTYRTEALVRQRLRRHSLTDDQTTMARATLRVYGKLLGTLELSDEERQALIEEIDRMNAQINLYCARRALFGRNRVQAIEQFGLANKVLKNVRVSAAIWALRLWPKLLYKYVERRFRIEESYVR